MDISSITLIFDKLSKCCGKCGQEVCVCAGMESDPTAADCEVCNCNPCVCNNSVSCASDMNDDQDMGSAIADLVRLSGRTVNESILTEIVDSKARAMDGLHNLGALLVRKAEEAAIRGATSEDPKMAERIRHMSRIGGMLADLGTPEETTSLDKISKPDLEFIASKLKMTVAELMSVVGIREGVEMTPYQDENDLEPMSKKQVMGDQPLVNNTGDNSMVDAEKPEKRLAVRTIKEAVDLIREMEMCEEQYRRGDSVRVASDNMHYGDMRGTVVDIDDKSDSVIVDLEDFGNVKISPRDLHKNHAMHPMFEDDLPGYDAWKTTSPYDGGEDVEAALDQAVSNFSMEEFLEHNSDQIYPDDKEEFTYTMQDISSMLRHYLAHWIKIHTEVEDIDASDVTEGDVKDLMNKTVLPYMREANYKVSPELKTVDESAEDNTDDKEDKDDTSDDSSEEDIKKEILEADVCPECHSKPCQCDSVEQAEEMNEEKDEDKAEVEDDDEDDDEDEKEEIKEAAKSAEEIKKEIADVEDKIKSIVDDGGHISISDPLSVKLVSLRKKLKDAKKDLKEGFTYGDKVVISGDRHHMGDEGEIVSIDKERGKVVVDLSGGHGRHSFSMSHVSPAQELDEEGAVMDAEPVSAEPKMSHTPQDLHSLAKEISSADDATYNNVIMELFGYSDPEHIISAQHIVDQLSSLNDDEVMAIRSTWVEPTYDMDGSYYNSMPTKEIADESTNNETDIDYIKNTYAALESLYERTGFDDIERLHEMAGAAISGAGTFSKSQLSNIAKEIKLAFEENGIADPRSVDEGNSHDDLRASPSDHDTLMKKNTADAKRGLSGSAYAGQLREMGSNAKELTDKILKLDDKTYVDVCKILFDAKNVYKPHDKTDILVAVESSDPADLNDLNELIRMHEKNVNSVGLDSDHGITEDEDLNEKAPPDQEAWVKANKAKFKKEYGDKKGEEVLYATAWKKHNESVELVAKKLSEEFNDFDAESDEDSDESDDVKKK